MNENDLARRVVNELDRRLADIPSPVTDRLAAGRRAALERFRARAARYGAHSTIDWLRDWIASHGVAARIAVPAVFVVVAAVAVFYLQSAPQHDPIEIEAALLADELPIHAYTDPGFDAWLRHTSHEQQ